MKKVALLLLCFMLSINLVAVSSVNAVSSTISVTTKIKEYKGQNYTELYGGNPAATKKINKVLKAKAVQNAIWSKENKAINGGYNYTSSKVVYNASEKISLIVTDVANVGGLSKLSYDFGYNFDLKTGKQLKLSDVVNTSNQKTNLNIAISNALKTQYSKGNLTESPISNNVDISRVEFYFYKEGIVLIFNEFTVDNYDQFTVTIPYKTLNSNVSKVMDVKNNPPKLTLDKNTKNTLEKGKIPGFGDIKFGDSKAEISRILGNSPSKSIQDLGETLFIYPYLDGVYFNFGSLDSLSAVIISLDNVKYTEIQDVLGKGNFSQADEYYDPDDDIPFSSLSYKFGKTEAYFYSDLKDMAQYVIIKHH